MSEELLGIGTRNQLVGDRNAVNVERLLAIECQGQRKRLSGRQPPLFMHEAEAPPAIVVDHYEKKHAAGVSGASSTVRERPGLVVGIGPALPVADADRTVGPARIRIRIGKNRTQQNCDRSSTAFHKHSPHTPRVSIFSFATGVHLERSWRLKISRRGKQKIGPASASCLRGGPVAEAVSLSSFLDYSAHRLDHRKIGADSHPPAAQQLIAWQKNRQDNAWTWHTAETVSGRGTRCVHPRSC
jgi:hypothetical protein